MATIVQPYNPWREQLALNALGSVAGNIIGDLWTQHRQSEQNKKANAFIGALQQNLSGGNDISFTQPQLPQGYNANPWASAFHANNSPIAQFDVATAQKSPSIQDIARNVDTLAATPRFSMLNPDTVQAVKNNMIQMAEAERLRGLQESYANQFGAAGSPMERMNVLTQSVMNGGVSPNVLNPYSDVARHMTMSPYQAASLQNARDIANIEANSRVNVANIGAMADNYRTDALMHGQDLDYDTENRRIDVAQQKVVQDERGNYYTVNQVSGKAKAITDDADTQIAGFSDRTDVLAQTLKAKHDKADTLDKKLKYIQSQMLFATEGGEAYKSLQQEAAKVQKELDDTLKDIDEITQKAYPETKHMPNRSTAYTPATASPTPTIAEVAAKATSADVAPTQTASNDVKPETPQQAPYIPSQSAWQSATPGKYRNAVPDIKTVAQAAKAHATPAQATQPNPAQNPTAKTSSDDVFLYKDMIYDSVRDKNLDSRAIHTPNTFRNLVNDMKKNPKFSHMTTKEIIKYLRKNGIKVKQ